MTVRDAAHEELPAPVTRQGDYFYTAYSVSNTNAAFAADLEITAVINPVGTNDPDIVKSEVRSAFLPQTPEAFVYDDDGNLLSDGRFSYTWNGENRLVAVSNATSLVASYAYDYLGRRISKTVGSETTTFLWNGNHIIHEKSSTRTNTYTWGQSDHLVSATLNGTNVFYCHDGNKNVTDLVNAFGNAVAHYEFDPFGNINVKTGVLADENPFRFSNEYHDPETGFVTYKYRPYNPVIGSWLSRDPIEEEGGVNLYGFVANNPVSNTDNLGRDFIAVGRTPVGGQFIANHMMILFFKENTCFPREGTRITPGGNNRAWLTHATLRGRFELIPEHIRYWQFRIFPRVEAQRVSISFIQEFRRTAPDELFVLYADTANRTVSDAGRRWRTVERAARNYAFAEHVEVGQPLRSWPNSEYGWPLTFRHFNNSNTFIYEMARTVGRSAVGVFRNTHGSKFPRRVRLAGPRPIPVW